MSWPSARPATCVGGVRSGRVYVYAGSPAGPGLVPRAVDRLGPGTGDEYGAALATGDVNHDGYPDLVVGAPGAQATGAINVFLGGTTGLAARLAGTEAAAPSPGRPLRRPASPSATSTTTGTATSPSARPAGTTGPARYSSSTALKPLRTAGSKAPYLVTQAHNGGVDEAGDQFGIGPCGRR